MAAMCRLGSKSRHRAVRLLGRQDAVSQPTPNLLQLGPVVYLPSRSLRRSFHGLYLDISLESTIIHSSSPPIMPAAVSIPPRDQVTHQQLQAGSPMSYKAHLGIPKSFRAAVSPFQGYGHLE